MHVQHISYNYPHWAGLLVRNIMESLTARCICGICRTVDTTLLDPTKRLARVGRACGLGLGRDSHGSGIEDRSNCFA